MKIKLTKHSMTRFCQPNELEQMISAGWKTVDKKDEAREESIRLTPAVKTKATVRAVEEANETTDKGDE
jgi:hypothetical protein